MNGFYKFALSVMRLIMPLWYKIEAEGLENLPQEGGYLFISNHRSNADPILIGVQNPETQFCFLAKQELFSDGPVGWLLRKLGGIAVDRGAGDITALEEIIFRLQNGQNALIFPEGTRSKDGKLGHFKTGAALIAAQTGVPVIPVAISFEDTLHFRSTICVRYGKPFQIPQTDSKNPSAAVLKQVRQEMTRNVSALLELNAEAAAEPKQADDAEQAASPAETAAENRIKQKKPEVQEKTMSKNNHNKKENTAPEKDVLKDAEEEVTEAAEETIDEVEDILNAADDEPAEDTADAADADDSDAEEAEPVDEDDFVGEEDEDDDEDDEDDAPAVMPFKLSNPFKKLMKKDAVDDDDFDDEDLEDDDDDDFDDDDDEDAEKGSLFGGFSLKGAFKKKESDGALDDDDFDDDFEDYDEESADGDDPDEYDDDEDAAGGKHVDYGRIALILTFVILGIFAVDFFRRLVNDWKSTQGILDIQNMASSTVDSMDGNSGLDDTPAMTTEPEDQEPASTVMTTTSEVTEETTTTTTAIEDDRETQTVVVANDTMHKGSLILIDGTHQQTATPDLIPFSSFQYQHLRLVRTDMQVDSSLAAPIINWFNDFYAATSLGNIMVYATVDTPAYPPYSTAIAERTSGLTLDLAILNEAAQSHSPYTADGNYAWLTEHAADYGFIVRYPAGKADKTGLDGMSWHFRYVGEPHAKYMYENDLCLEEYLILLQDHTWNSEHLTTTVNGVEYEIYYVPAAEDDTVTEIKYPITDTAAQPLISGDNNNGFVVAIPKE